MIEYKFDDFGIGMRSFLSIRIIVLKMRYIDDHENCRYLQVFGVTGISGIWGQVLYYDIMELDETSSDKGCRRVDFMPETSPKVSTMEDPSGKSNSKDISPTC